MDTLKKRTDLSYKNIRILRNEYSYGPIFRYTAHYPRPIHVRTICMRHEIGVTNVKISSSKTTRPKQPNVQYMSLLNRPSIKPTFDHKHRYWR